jgi:hypothetical protein
MLSGVRRIGCAAALCSVSVLGQTSRDWASLGHPPPIAAGTEIEARTTDNKRYRGHFESVTDDALVIGTDAGEQRLPRATVSRVSVKKASHRLRNTAIGFGAGAAGGLSLGAVADARCTGKCIEGNTPWGKYVGTALGALIGTIIGVAIPTGGWHEVYRVK